MFENTKRMGRWLAVAAAIGLVCFSQVLGKKPDNPGGGGGGISYAIVRLDDSAENVTWECQARDINNFGAVVGKAEVRNPPEQRAAYWSVTASGGDIQSELSLLIGGRGASGINDVGEIVGYGKDTNGLTVALYWAHAGAAPEILPRLNANMPCGVSAISNDGIACGWSGGQAVAWRVNWDGGEPSVWGPLVLPALDDPSYALAIGNNDEAGCAEIVGYLGPGGDPTAAVAWTVQSLSDGTLTAVDMRIVEAGVARALGVNDAGAICGWRDWPAVPVVWIGDEAWPLDLAHAKDIVDGIALDINNNGTIVGCGSSGMIDDEAVVWPNLDARMVRLNKYVGRKSPFVFLVEAAAVNDSGQIVGFGFTEVGGAPDAGFLAIPE